MSLSCIISEIKQDIGQKLRFWTLHLHSAPPLGGSRQNIAISFSKKARMVLLYPMVKSLSICLLVSTTIHERDGRPHRQTDTQTTHDSIAAFMHSIARQNCEVAAAAAERVAG